MPLSPETSQSNMSSQIERNPQEPEAVLRAIKENPTIFFNIVQQAVPYSLEQINEITHLTGLRYDALADQFQSKHPKYKEGYAIDNQIKALYNRLTEVGGVNQISERDEIRDEIKALEEKLEHLKSEIETELQNLREGKSSW